MEGLLKTGLKRRKVTIWEDGDNRYLDGILYKITAPGTVPDALLERGDKIERLTCVSKSFKDPKTAFAFMKKDGRLWQNIMDELKEEDEDLFVAVDKAAERRKQWTKARN